VGICQGATGVSPSSSSGEFFGFSAAFGLALAPVFELALAFALEPVFEVVVRFALAPVFDDAVLGFVFAPVFDPVLDLVVFFGSAAKRDRAVRKARAEIEASQSALGMLTVCTDNEFAF
jgi:hypothetical protein